MNRGGRIGLTGTVAASFLASFALSRVVHDAAASTTLVAVIGVVILLAARRRPALGFGLGVAAQVVASTWAGLRVLGHGSPPSSRTFGSLRASLRASRSVLEAFQLPLPHTAGLVFLVALFGGLVALGTMVLGLRNPTIALGFAAIPVIWSIVVLPTDGAALTALAFGTSGLLVVGRDRLGASRASGLIALAVVAVAALTLGWQSVSGAQQVAPGGRFVPAVAPSALSLTTDLTGIESKDAQNVLFRARSSIPTYWQVTSLDVFTGATWIPDATTQEILDGAPPPPPAPEPGSRSGFAARVTLSAYSGRLLPAPPDTFAVTGPGQLAVTPFGVVTPVVLAPQGSYRTESSRPLAASDISNTATPDPADTAVGPISDQIRALAVSITESQTLPLDKAEAIVDYLRSGRFRYAVTPGPSSQAPPLVTFLTRTRTGSCEEFAGAFAVLARASGLPTRVALGFTPGTPDQGDYIVRGRDAHAWPQVLIGGRWISFEPTPQLPSGELSPPGVLGPAALGRPNPVGPVSTTPVSIPTATSLPGARQPTVPVPTIHPSDQWAYVVAGSILAGGVLALTLLWFLRRRRPHLDELTQTWLTIDAALARRDLGRPPSRTPLSHVRDLVAVPPTDGAAATTRDMEYVATLLQEVSFGAKVPSPIDVTRAQQASRRVSRAIRSGELSGTVVRSRSAGDRPVDAHRQIWGRVR